jgi:Domain of unknown function (DUF4159)
MTHNWIARSTGPVHRLNQSKLTTAGLVLVMLAVLSTLLFAPSRAAAQQTQNVASADQVDSAIRRAIAFLYSRQNAKGHWDLDAPKDPKIGYSVENGQWGGHTALIVYTLLAAGEDPNNPKLKQAIDWVRSADIRGVYAVGMRAQIWLYLPNSPQNRAAMERDASILLQLQHRQSGNAKFASALGMWDYIAQTGRVDTSITQYGVLGLWAAAQYGLQIPSEVWRLNQDSWARWAHIRDPRNGQWVKPPNPQAMAQALQAPDMRVGWAYTGNPEGEHQISPALTAAGAASLFITQEYLGAEAAVACNGNQQNILVDAAMNNLVAELPNVFSGNPTKHRFYTIYGIERTGVASGLKYFGNRDWFKVGSTFIVGRQGGDGSWSDGDGQLPDTCFGILFLARGREPVMFNKIKYSIIPDGPARGGNRQRASNDSASGATAQPREGNWNQRPRDVAHLARFVGKQSERAYNWQVLDLAIAPLQDLIEAPVLYFAGNQRINLPEDQVNKLRDYIERGGILFFNPDCNAKPFVQGVEALAKQLYPDREFIELAENHPMMDNQLFPVSKMKGRKPRVRAITNGARLLVVLAAEDLGKNWQAKETQSRAESFQIATNLFQYAIDKEFAQVKGRSHLVLPNPQSQTNQTIKVARLKYNGEWNPEPGGWRQLAAVMRNGRRIDLQVQTVELGIQPLSDFKVAHLTGTREFAFTDEQRAALKEFVEKGNVLIVDAAGGSAEFKAAIEVEFSKIFGEQRAGELINRELAPNSPVFTAGGGAADRISYRAWAQRSVGTLDRAQLRGMVVNGRLGVIYSAEDLSLGIVGNQVDGVNGYSPSVATALMQRALIYGNNPSPVNTGTAQPAK